MNSGKISKGFLIFSNKPIPLASPINRGGEGSPFHPSFSQHMPCNDMTFFLSLHEIVS